MHESYQKWLDNGCPKIFCECSCSKEIIITLDYKYRGVPKYISGHNNRIYSIPESYKKWLNNNCPKIFCNCGCNDEIVIKESHKYDGIPKYIHGHNWKGKQHTEETKQKMRKPKSEETKQKMRIYHIGKLPSPKSGRGRGSYYNSLLQDKIWLRSSYELKFAQYLDKNNIPWLYEIETFNLGDTTYTPDFYLPTSNLWIEIKGYMREKYQIKINKFLDNYTNETLKILYKEDLIKLGIKI